MFELLRPNKAAVGKRIRAVKDELGVSLTELGDRLGLIKPTINSYVQGYTLASHEVVQKLANITGKSIGWFYFGDMEEYIHDYLLKKGHEQLLIDYPDLPARLKEEFLNSQNESWNWKNDFGYPCEASIDDVFAEIYHDIMREYLSAVTKEYLASYSTLDSRHQEEAVCLITAELYECFSELGDFEYGERDKIESSIKYFYDRDVKDKNISFCDEYLIGKLINVLSDNRQTIDLIGDLSQTRTGKGRFNPQFGGQELLDIFQSMRPALIKLYTEHTSDRLYEWFEK